MPAIRYKEIPAEQVPDGLRFDVPGRNQGQIVEVAYADNLRARSSAPADVGATYRRTTDGSDRSVVYAKRS
jgi:hypothetical protein